MIRTAIILAFLIVSSCAYSSSCDSTDFSCNAWATLFLFQPQKYGQVSNGFDSHTVLLFPDGTIRAWGGASNGRLGNNDGSTNTGDGAGPSIIATGDIQLGAFAEQVSAGHQTTCARLTDSNVKCWGFGGEGRTGYNSEDNIGDGIGLSVRSAPIVPIGMTVQQVEAGPHFTCALLTNGNVRCWGNSPAGETGYNSTSRIGDGLGLSIMAAGDVPLGNTAKFIDVGGDSACAVLTDGAVRCWGNGANGRLGHNSTTNIGDGGLTIITAGDVPLGGLATAISVGLDHTCALLVSGAVRCWGLGTDGRLGHNSTSNIGDGGQTIISAGDVPLGGLAKQVVAGSNFTCALLTNGAVRCWGYGTDGALGYNSPNRVGDGIGSTIVTAGDVPVGGSVHQIAAGGAITCALMESVPTRVRCWGGGGTGALGFNSTANIGDGTGQSIITAGDVPVGKN